MFRRNFGKNGEKFCQKQLKIFANICKKISTKKFVTDRVDSRVLLRREELEMNTCSPSPVKTKINPIETITRPIYNIISKLQFSSLLITCPLKKCRGLGGGVFHCPQASLDWSCCHIVIFKFSIDPLPQASVMRDQKISLQYEIPSEISSCSSGIAF